MMELPCSLSRRIDKTKCNLHRSMGNTPLLRKPAPCYLGASIAQQAHPVFARATLSSQTRSAAATATAPSATAEDKWIAHTLDAVSPSDAATPAQLSSLRSSCLAALATQRMPTNKNEDYRFTDISPVLQSTLVAPSAVSADLVATAVAARSLKKSTAASLVVVDGALDTAHTTINDLPKGVYVGGLVGAPSDVVGFALGTQSRSRGGPFATLNGAVATDTLVIHVPEGVTVTEPIHIVHLSSSASSSTTRRTVSAPRVLVVLEEGAAAEIIEEYSSINDTQGQYMVTAVTEIELDDTAVLKHSYIELEADGAAHFKTTLVNQGKESNYSLTEARIGGALTRHDLSVEQLGSKTETVMKSFLLAGQGQLHDLHSKLILDHPDGRAEQIHKCIAVDPTSRGVFDGNVRVNRLAQRTDAQQLSRNLLMAPKATVNVKPNLQIIADDVKCTHGCSVSDLEEEEMFYLRSRGISEEAARQVLVYSFGREVVQHLKDDAAIGRVEVATKKKLVAVVSPVV
ncbi:hypothetical protein Ndes2437B_g02327 [Nannochloris sp. 'desiccata']